MTTTFPETKPLGQVMTLDQQLVSLATTTLSQHIPDMDENHSVASVTRSHSGETFVGVNVYHFTGGPCAELVVLGAAAAADVFAKDLATIVAVARRPGGISGEDPSFDVMSPCGRCRQVLMDYNPDIQVLVAGEGGKLVPTNVWALLPHAYVWPDGVTGQSQG
jgi:cytidine deaminase